MNLEEVAVNKVSGSLGKCDNLEAKWKNVSRVRKWSMVPNNAKRSSKRIAKEKKKLNLATLISDLWQKLKQKHDWSGCKREWKETMSIKNSTEEHSY